MGKRMLVAAFAMLFSVAWVKAADQCQSQCQHQSQCQSLNNEIEGNSWNGYGGQQVVGNVGSRGLLFIGEYVDAFGRWGLSPIFGHTYDERARRAGVKILEANAVLAQRAVQKIHTQPQPPQPQTSNAVIEESLRQEVLSLQKQVLDAEKRVHEAELRAIQAKPIVVAPPKPADDDKKADLEKKLETALAVAARLQQQLDTFKAQQVEMARQAEDAANQIVAAQTSQARKQITDLLAQAEADRKAANSVIADLRKQIEDLRTKAEADERKAGAITTDFQKLTVGLLARAEVAERAAERALDRSRLASAAPPSEMKVRIVVTHDGPRVMIRGGTTTE